MKILYSPAGLLRWLIIVMMGLGQNFLTWVSSGQPFLVWVSIWKIFLLKITNFSIFFPSDQKKSLLIGSKSTGVKDESASYL